MRRLKIKVDPALTRLRAAGAGRADTVMYVSKHCVVVMVVVVVVVVGVGVVPARGGQCPVTSVD